MYGGNAMQMYAPSLAHAPPGAYATHLTVPAEVHGLGAGGGGHHGLPSTGPPGEFHRESQQQQQPPGHQQPVYMQQWGAVAGANPRTHPSATAWYTYPTNESVSGIVYCNEQYILYVYVNSY